MTLRPLAQLPPETCDAVFADDDSVLTLDEQGNTWRIDLSGSRTPVSSGREVRAVLPVTGIETPRQIAWNDHSKALVVHVDHDADWSLLCRTASAPWRVLLRGSRLLSHPTLQWTPDGSRLAVDVDGVAVVDVGDAAASCLELDDAEAWGWTPSGLLLVYACVDPVGWAMKLVDVRTAEQRLLGSLDPDIDAWGYPIGLAVGRAADTCVVAYRRCLVWYDLNTLKAVRLERDDSFLVDEIEVTADRSLAVVHAERQIRVWSMAGEPRPRLTLPAATARAAPSSRRLVVRSDTATSQPWSICAWDDPTSEPPHGSAI